MDLLPFMFIPIIQTLRKHFTFFALPLFNLFQSYLLLNPATAISPLVFVVAVSMIREAIEDYIRYKSDKGKLH